MISLKALLFQVLGASTAVALPSPGPSSNPLPSLLSSRGTPISNGISNGFFYSFWTDGGGDVNYQNGADGSYSVRWANCSSFYGGKGWMPGRADRSITYSGTFNPEGNGYLSVYGFAKNPLLEYYIIESYGTFDPTLLFQGGSGNQSSVLEVDGGSYRLGMKRVVRMELGSGAVLTQVYSVRDKGDRRQEGTVNIKAHFDAWKEKLGVRIGTLDFQIVATEGYQSSGVAEIEVEQSA
ncbi:endo-1,4-beta-xylanase B [Parachaetomium inaequale]|uniref:Endo-1,4-beta-xylanase n=1 Tax=Parachaetomium inaequale TaxID=2588326 RepID=A0AAN6PGD3_9PEZI|nr:endo-1,4-beta-xylanase B [Parachaetomium inaequale]